MKPTQTLGEPRSSDLGIVPARWRVLLSFTRPFTLLPPLLGVVSGAITAYGSAHNPDPLRRVDLSLLATVGLGSLCAAFLNAASNGINQVYDLEIDRKNKPGRPLVSGALGLREGKRFSALLYVLAIMPTWLVMTYPHTRWSERVFAPPRAHECFWIFVAGLLFTLIYSVPSFGRTKRNGFWANLTIAIPRGCLLKVAGWSMVASVAHPEPWYIGSVFFLFLLGASTTKDFSDMEGDAAHGCITLPIRYGVRRAAWMITPFFIFPWLLLPLGAHLPDPVHAGGRLLSGNPTILTAVGLLLTLWGCLTSYLVIRRPEELATTENHPSWTHMYLMMMLAQVGFAVAYLF
ncbi:MAG TPA: UbiA family prenyltransferase [Candidatus Polarisedimenticolia bacterium]|nr:UbiA family prenyltransferase [Candidatus Polarisedimenticolia bacterium]